MGIPIAAMVKKKGQIRSIECMGCGRCVNICPKNALSFHGVTDFVRKKGESRTRESYRINQCLKG
jgi:ferredoxin